jgi:hypothetical protein
MYRDGGNFKQHGIIVFAGLIGTGLEERLVNALEGGKYFIAHQVRVPEKFLWDPKLDYGEEYPKELMGSGRYKINDMDHVWHEFNELKLTDWIPTDIRTIEEFIVEVKVASSEGWDKNWLPENRM